MSFVFWTIVATFGLFALRNLIAWPIASIMRGFNVQNSTDKARELVGSIGSLFYICVCLLGLYIFWHLGILQAVGEGFGNVFSNLFGFFKLLPAAVMELLA